MGLLKKLFGAIFGLFAALGKLLGLGKKGEFYVELEPTAPSPTPVAAPEPSPAVATPKPDPAPVAAAAAVEPPPAAPAPAQATASEVSSRPYTQFARRRPGANMASFLAMARQVRPST
ncbi:hypothetical protein BRW62_02415 [Parathermosynechococcus lividus PCC 6715]|uniref:Uncharacterized protein n=1 Tax=Parathermosynechococcus lividus PCC 6715 TaxID=1917166 RepID=A0A2D2PZX1_PARLV|nr:hypothetical protein [Thermostichus lividus]ATS17788.1 hypothetical protein BRW62_02415 [Thermostichus lividus PCC 6715]